MPQTNPDGSALTVGFIGAGMMGGAMLGGLITSGTVAALNVRVFDVEPARLEALTAQHPGLATVSSNAHVGLADVVIIAVEPKDCEEVCAELVTAGSRVIFVSLAAGVTLASLGSWLPPSSRIVRVMPNTPCTVGEMAAYAVP